MGTIYKYTGRSEEAERNINSVLTVRTAQSTIKII